SAHAGRPLVVAAHPDPVRDPARHLLAQPPLGVRLMERSVYDNVATLERRHWWYVARRDVLDRLIRRRIRLPGHARILEIGCGTGHNLPMLRQFGEVDAIEIDAAAREMASRRLGKPVMAHPLPNL